MRNKIVRVFMDTDMRCQHAGLKKIAQEKGVKIDELDHNEHLIFINGKKNRIKFFSFNKVISYFYQQKGMLDLHMIDSIARTFDDRGQVNFDEALKLSLLKRLKGNNENMENKKGNRATNNFTQGKGLPRGKVAVSLV